MKTLSCFILLFLLIISSSCSNTKTDQLSETDTAATASSKPATDTVLAKLKAQAKPTQQTDTTIQTHIMRWQQVLVNESGTSYEFIDRNGNPYSCMINMPDFDFYNNKFFTAKYAPQAQFPTITWKEGVNEAWYHITIKVQEGEDEDGVKATYNVVTAIEPLNKE